MARQHSPHLKESLLSRSPSLFYDDTRVNQVHSPPTASIDLCTSLVETTQCVPRVRVYLLVWELITMFKNTCLLSHIVYLSRLKECLLRVQLHTLRIFLISVIN